MQRSDSKLCKAKEDRLQELNEDLEATLPDQVYAQMMEEYSVLLTQITECDKKIAELSKLSDDKPGSALRRTRNWLLYHLCTYDYTPGQEITEIDKQKGRQVCPKHAQDDKFVPSMHKKCLVVAPSKKSQGQKIKNPKKSKFCVVLKKFRLSSLKPKISER